MAFPFNTHGCAVYATNLQFWYESQLPFNADIVLGFSPPFSYIMKSPARILFTFMTRGVSIFWEEQILAVVLVQRGNLEGGSLLEEILAVLSKSLIITLQLDEIRSFNIPPRPNGGAPGKPPKAGGAPTPAAGPW